MTSSWERYRSYAEKALAEGRYEEAEAMWLAALEEAERLGDRDPRLPMTIEHLADVALKQEKPELAEQLYKKALIIKANIFGPYHLDVGSSANNLAELYCAHGKFELAEPLYWRVLKIYEQSFGPEHVGVAIISTNLAIMYHAQEKYAEAEPLYKRAIAINQKISGYQHANTLRILDNYVDLLQRMNRLEEAQKIVEMSQGSVSGVWKRTLARLPSSDQTLIDMKPVRETDKPPERK